MVTPSAFCKTILESGASDFFTIQKTQEGNEIEVLVQDLKGNKLSDEKIKIEQGQFTIYSWQQFQTGEKVKLELKNNKVHFSSEDKNKVIELSTDELKKIVLPALLTDSLVTRIKQAPKAKKFEVMIIVPDKMFLLNFNFELKSQDKEKSVWVLNPDSFFVGLVVGPVTFTFDKDLKLLKIKDIMLPIRPTQKTEIVFK
jgi:ribosomal protein L25 (general stress protein Ctc)